MSLFEKYNRYTTAIEALSEIVKNDNEPHLKVQIDYLRQQRNIIGREQLDLINNCNVVYEEVTVKSFNHASIN
ncbi:hypothetical protein [Flavobacterium suncheonense]|uniref:Uncharacterized protein n=1 Tax=Flavobacterium suncheonense GH29-5 = DSM 17707 TaxID=1121899 RepID=A0A0A2MDP4_9FLAO|nr:hypothetical protein [Flavobacterium suncheonense]KGO89573.1 hypothetical protein Q764_07325 [Flavobacterium suncheonense GH29-5 = DSM 17707]